MFPFFCITHVSTLWRFVYLVYISYYFAQIFINAFLFFFFFFFYSVALYRYCKFFRIRLRVCSLYGSFYPPVCVSPRAGSVDLPLLLRAEEGGTQCLAESSALLSRPGRQVRPRHHQQRYVSIPRPALHHFHSPHLTSPERSSSAEWPYELLMREYKWRCWFNEA